MMKADLHREIEAMPRSMAGGRAGPNPSKFVSLPALALRRSYEGPARPVRD
jgi:hypothetical protein